MAVDSRSPRPPDQLRPRSSSDGNSVGALRYSFTFLAGNWRQAAANDEPGVP